MSLSRHSTVVYGVISIVVVLVSWFLYGVLVDTELDQNMIDEQIVAEDQSIQLTSNKIVTNAVPDKYSKCVLLEDFTGETDLRWYAVNDGVMGGLSIGRVEVASGTLIHKGEIVTRGGGFSYVGTQLPKDILVGYNSVLVRMNSGGRTYAANFADSRAWRVSHQVLLPETTDTGWQEVVINFADTVPTIFSRQVDSALFDPSAVEELAFILSDGVDGSFETEIDWVKLCI